MTPFLRYDLSSFDPSSSDRSSFAGPVCYEVRAPTIADCLEGQPPGPAVLACGLAIFERVVASEPTENYRIHDFGKQHVTGRKTMRLGQVFKSAIVARSGTFTPAVRVSYRSAPRTIQGIRSLLRNPPGGHLYLLGIPERFFPELVRESRPLGEEQRVLYELSRTYLGHSKAAHEARLRVLRFARTTAVVLIMGERGSGKGVLAKLLHAYSGRGGEMTRVNCASIAPSLFSSEMFGVAHRACTDVAAQAGFFEVANGRTLFLDEIGDLPLELQPVLLSVMQDREITRVGARRPVPLDIKLIVATNKDLRAMVAEGRFRGDLYDRLNQLVIRTPSLSDSKADFYVHLRQAWSERSETPLTRSQENLLAAQAWPGNVRQLQNFLDKLSTLSDGPPTTDFIRECLREEEGAVKTARRAPSSQPVRPAPRTGSALEEMVAEYMRNRALFLEQEGTLRFVVERLVHDELPFAKVQSRTKTPASLAIRLQRRGVEGSYWDVDDLVGIRVVVHEASQKQTVREAVGRYLEIEEVAPDADDPCDATTFRIRIDAARAKALGAHLGIEFEREATGHGAELQVRTSSEDTLHTVREEFFRVPMAPMPKAWTDEFAELANALTRAETALERMRSWHGSYGAYLEPSMACAELEILEGALRCVATDPRLAARAGRLAIALGEFERAIGLLAPCVGSRFGPVLRDLGVALCQINDVHSAAYRQGLGFLRQACDVSPRDPDAFASLAGARRRIGGDDNLLAARDLYWAALRIDGSFPYAVSGLLEIDLLLNPGADAIAASLPLLKRAIARCREQVDAAVSMPWCHYNLGKFLVLTGRAREGLEHYARAIGKTTAPFMIESSYRSVASLTGAACVPRSLEIARWMLAVAGCALFPSERSIARLVETIPSSKPPVAGPVVMVVGDGGDRWSTQMAALREVAAAGLRDFRGTLMTVGGLATIAGAASGGAIDPPRFKAVSYRLTDVAVLAADPQVPLFVGEAPYPSLAPWRDLLVSGVRPSRVLLLAVGDDPRTTPDRRFARRLGAKVAVLEPGAASDPAPGVPAGDAPVRGGEVPVRDGGALRALIAQLSRR